IFKRAFETKVYRANDMSAVCGEAPHSETENIFVGIEVAGDEIFGGSFGLKVTRTENGVEVRIYG
ncbi:MAG: hypothetical protein QXH08_05825, partial [Candidatus Hadarchaeales archaeon]